MGVWKDLKDAAVREAERQNEAKDAKKQSKVEQAAVQAAHVASLPRWEYKVLNTGWMKNNDAASLERTLNALGAEGWELVGTADMPATAMNLMTGPKFITQYLLKRPAAR